MKKTAKILALILVVAFALCSVACSKYGRIQKALENEGYTVIEDAETVQKTIVEAWLGDGEESAVKIHLFNKDIVQIVVVLEFKATDDMVQYVKKNQSAKDAVKSIANNEDVKKVYNDLVEAGFAKGNCFVVGILTDVREIVKNA